METTKDSIGWLLIRFIGLAFLLAFIYCIHQIAILILLYMSTDPTVTVAADGIETIRFPNFNWEPIFNGFFTISFAIYFLRYGKAAHKLLIKK